MIKPQRRSAQRCVGGASLRDGKPRALPKEDAAAAAAEAAASALPIVAEMVDVFNRRARGIKLLVLARCAKARDGAKTLRMPSLCRTLLCFQPGRAGVQNQEFLKLISVDLTLNFGFI